MPPTTAAPIERWLAAPGPDAYSSGSVPSTKAAPVITIARNRSLAASTAAAEASAPSRLRCNAKSTIRIELLQDIANSSTTPICV